jgi:glutaredoxin
MENNSNPPVLENTSAESDKKEDSILSRKNIYLFAIIILLLLGGFVFSYQKKAVVKKETAIRDNTEKFIKENLIQPGTDFKITEFVKEGSLYKLTASVSGQNITAYVSEDGKKFFPSVIDLTPAAATDNTQAQAQAQDAQKEIPKNNKPNVDLYVMAFCPYGNKAEDTLKPAYDLLKNKVNFNFHYIVSTNGSDVQSLHGAKEVTQDEREACVLKNYGKDKWMSFVTYINDKCGSDGSCWEAGAKSLGINTAGITACVSSQGLALMQQNEKDSKAAKASGSPTLTINGVSSSAVYSYGNSEAYKQAICSVFTNQPKECQTQLVDNSAAQGSATAGSAAACAPAQ